MNSYRTTKLVDTLNLTHWYQPIYELESCKVIGYEALVRNKPLYNLSPIDIFQRAEHEGCRTILDFQLLFRAIDLASKSHTHMIFLNVFPSTLLEKWFIPLWDKHLAIKQSLVLEISENECVSDWKALIRTVNVLKDKGVKIAIDDMGSGYSFFRHWIELQPDYIKLDGYYSMELSHNLLKQKVHRNF